jgi:hypothetical protein
MNKLMLMGSLTLALFVVSVTAKAESDLTRYGANAVRVADFWAPASDAIHAMAIKSDLDSNWRGDLSDRRFIPSDGRQIRDAGVAQSATSQATTHSAVAAPEIDPASAASSLLLLFGGIAVLRSRRKLMPS